MGKLLARQKQVDAPSFTFCPLINVSLCPSTMNLAKGQVVPVVAYNPLGWARTHNFRIPVPISDVSVVLSSSEPVATQIMRSSDPSGLPFTLAFSLDLPPLGYFSFVLRPTTSSISINSAVIVPPKRATLQKAPPTANADFVLENKYLRATFSGVTGRLAVIENKMAQPNRKVVIDQGLFWYDSSTGNSQLSTQPSGAYIFRPNETFAYNTSKDNVPSMQFVAGQLYSEVRQTFNSWAKQIVRLYADQPFLEFEYTIGPIDIADGLGKEVITRYATRGFPTDKTW
jgi:lysosomal alpha-mannosidase